MKSLNIIIFVLTLSVFLGCNTLSSDSIPRIAIAGLGIENTQYQTKHIIMNSSFEFLDYLIFVLYAIVILGVGLWVSRNKKGEEKSAEDYFLAGKSLPWWAIGASLIAANISAEQFIGMSGSGFALGLAIASYEWMAAITLIIVGKYFLPIFIEKKLYTIPEFVEKRFSSQLKTILAIFWISLYVFVNLASVMYLGGLALETIIGIDLVYAVLGLALFAAAYSLYGGLTAVAWTDIIQVVFLVLGGLVTTYLALDTVSQGQGVLEGLKSIYKAAPDRFEMILDKGNPEYNNLPGIGVLVGGLWVANLYYWGFNQYIIQRTLAAKSLRESQKGILFAAGLKLIIPLIVLIIIKWSLNTFSHSLGSSKVDDTVKIWMIFKQSIDIAFIL